ncbi:MAG: hypothetical protein QOF48_2293 [Verrucomicrobiota bacterium]
MRDTTWQQLATPGKFCGSTLNASFVAEQVNRETYSVLDVPGQAGMIHCLVVEKVVAGDGIEPPTQGFSVLCSTN